MPAHRQPVVGMNEKCRKKKELASLSPSYEWPGTGKASTKRQRGDGRGVPRRRPPGRAPPTDCGWLEVLRARRRPGRAIRNVICPVASGGYHRSGGRSRVAAPLRGSADRFLGRRRRHVRGIRGGQFLRGLGRRDELRLFG